MNLKSRVLGATVLWKRLNTETDPKVSLGPFPSFFSRIIGNPSKTKKCRGISEYFGPVSAIFTFDSFPLFLGPFPPFWVRFLLFGSVSGFQKKFKILSLLIGFLFFGSVSSFFGSISGFQKKFQNLSFLNGFLFYWVCFLIF